MFLWLLKGVILSGVSVLMLESLVGNWVLWIKLYYVLKNVVLL